MKFQPFIRGSYYAFAFRSFIIYLIIIFLAARNMSLVHFRARRGGTHTFSTQLRCENAFEVSTAKWPPLLAVSSARGTSRHNLASADALSIRLLASRDNGDY